MVARKPGRTRGSNTAPAFFVARRRGVKRQFSLLVALASLEYLELMRVIGSVDTLWAAKACAKVAENHGQ